MGKNEQEVMEEIGVALERDELRSHHGHQCENFLDQLHISDTSQ